MVDNMQANELRIRNFVQYNGVICQVYSIESPLPRKESRYSDKELVTLVCHGLITVCVEECEPVLITEERLLKFGFVKQRTVQNSYCKQLKSKLWFTIYETGEAVDYNEFQNNEPEIWYVSDDKFGVKIKYVHQLQNYFYALTGEELQLNENTNGKT